MATVTKPIALDESINTTEVTPRNVADVLAQELANIATAIGGGGGSGGHTIENSSGTALPQRTNLQFTDGLNATDDSGNDSTVVSGSALATKTDIATVESGSTASRAYSVGELVYVNGNLYKVITAISLGSAFTVGTNIQSTTVGAMMSGGSGSVTPESGVTITVSDVKVKNSICSMLIVFTTTASKTTFTKLMTITPRCAVSPSIVVPLYANSPVWSATSYTAYLASGDLTVAGSGLPAGTYSFSVTFIADN